MKKLIFAAVIFLFGCGTPNLTVLSSEPIMNEKVIALKADRKPWIIEIEKRLKQNGYRIYRTSTANIAEETQGNRKITYKEANTRLTLQIEGSYYTNRRCFGGGYLFEYITAEIVDNQTNETLASYSSNGYSENCPPMSGTIFTDISNMVDIYFQ